jgi:hypothetical protein
MQPASHLQLNTTGVHVDPCIHTAVPRVQSKKSNQGEHIPHKDIDQLSHPHLEFDVEIGKALIEPRGISKKTWKLSPWNFLEYVLWTDGLISRGPFFLSASIGIS